MCIIGDILSCNNSIICSREVAHKINNYLAAFVCIITEASFTYLPHISNAQEVIVTLIFTIALINRQ